MDTSLVSEGAETGDGVVEGDGDLNGVGDQVLDFSLQTRRKRVQFDYPWRDSIERSAYEHRKVVLGLDVVRVHNVLR